VHTGKYQRRQSHLEFPFIFGFCSSGSLGGLGGFGGGLGGFGGGLGGPICGVPIGFGMTTTVGGLNPYTDDIYATGPGYGASLGYGATGISPLGAGGLPGGFSRGLNRGPYSRPY
jgi:hypothetical protein